MQKLMIRRPDDWHLHLRDGAALKTTVADAAKRFARATIMPNLNPPITTITTALAYRERILAAVPRDIKFEPWMTLYLTDTTPIKEVLAAKHSGIIKAFKLYPAGATTHSHQGITRLENIYPILGAMEEAEIILLIHGEVTDANLDIFDREAVFIERELTPLLQRFPKLRIVLEHISTQEAVSFVLEAPEILAATITAHHLLLNRNDLLVNGIHPHYYCLPILKRDCHQHALIRAATSGNKKFFLGTDSAPHAQKQKENCCGCAGIYTAHAAIELYAEVFEQANALDKLESFASIHGADFYRLPVNQDTITLAKQPWKIPSMLPFGDDQVIPLRAGENVHWKIL